MRENIILKSLLVWPTFFVEWILEDKVLKLGGSD